MINTEIRQFRDSLIAITNSCPLPIEIKRLVFSEIHTQINSESEKMIIAEKQQEEKNNQKEEDNNG